MSDFAVSQSLSNILSTVPFDVYCGRSKRPLDSTRSDPNDLLTVTHRSGSVFFGRFIVLESTEKMSTQFSSFSVMPSRFHRVTPVFPS